MLAEAIRRGFPIRCEIEVLRPIGAHGHDLRRANARDAIGPALVAVSSNQIPAVRACHEPERVHLAHARLAVGFLVEELQPLATPERLQYQWQARQRLGGVAPIARIDEQALPHELGLLAHAYG